MSTASKGLEIRWFSAFEKRPLCDQLHPISRMLTAPLLYDPEIARPDTRKHPVELSRG